MPEAPEPIENGSLKRPSMAVNNSAELHLPKKARMLEAEDTPESKTPEKDQKEVNKRLEKQKKQEMQKALREKKEAEKKLERERKEAEKKAEKEKKEAERKAEKERKEAEKLAEKLRKEAEKQHEKERKEAEKQAEKQRKEAEKQAAKELKEKEQLKAQPRINLFFKTSASPSVAPSSSLTSEHNSQASSGHAAASSDSSAANQPVESEYRKYILPFHVKQNAKLFSGTCNYAYTDSDSQMDPVAWLAQQGTNLTQTPKPSKLTSDQFRTQLALAQESSQVAHLLTCLRIRRVQFSHLSARYLEDQAAPVNEEFRPPYIGSVRDIDEHIRKELAVSPFSTNLLDHVAYEYDSEVEWDQEDGEDLRDDDGDDSDEDLEDQEELKEFLSSDEDESSTAKMTKLLGPLTPVVIWGANDTTDALHPFTMELLHGAIDPHKFDEVETADGLMASSGSKTEATSSTSFASLIKPLESKVGFEALKSSLLTYNGSTGTKTLIVELLKQQFPAATGQEIRNVFDRCMERVGKKRSEKKWILNRDATEYFMIPGAEKTQKPEIFSNAVIATP